MSLVSSMVIMRALYKCSSRQYGLPPKVLAATATIEAYKKQCYEIYLKDATRFPESGWKLGESFYATSTPLIERRIYVGVLGHTRALEEPILRNSGSVHRGAPKTAT